MIVKNHIIECGQNRKFNLYPIGDLQYGSRGFNEGLWRECAYLIKHDQSSIFVGMGDYSDWFRPTNQAKIAGMRSGDDEFAASLDELYEHHNEKIFHLLSPVIKKDRSRTLGLLSGHHEFKYSHGANSTQELCRRFGVDHLGRMAFIRLIFRSAGEVWTLKVHAQHGDGGGSSLGADMANLERKTAPYWMADLILRGHSTKLWHFRIPRMDMTESTPPRIVERPVVCVNTGGFMRGYLEGDQNDPNETYVSVKNMSPAHLGFPVVHLNLERHRPTTSQKGRNIKITVTD